MVLNCRPDIHSFKLYSRSSPSPTTMWRHYDVNNFLETSAPSPNPHHPGYHLDRVWISFNSLLQLKSSIRYIKLRWMERLGYFLTSQFRNGALSSEFPFLGSSLYSNAEFRDIFPIPVSILLVRESPLSPLKSIVSCNTGEEDWI